MADLGNPAATAVGSIDEMLAIAQAMEREAAERYALLADCMRRVDQGEIADLLSGLAAEERDHVAHVDRLARQTLQHEPDPGLVSRALPETFGPADEVSAAALLSPYRMLSIAVRHEERAFSFWTYVAAQAADAGLRELAETFARQELVHAAKLRRARRKAYHAERKPRPPIERDEADGPSPAEVRAEAAALEAAFAAFCAAAAEGLSAAPDKTTGALFAQLAHEAGRAAASLRPADAAPRAPDQEPQTMRARRHGANSAALLFEAEGMIEDLGYRYLDWLDRAASESLVRDLEARTQATTSRLARISERLLSLEPSLAAIGGA
jgi:rubrerythrin